ncbi:MAG: alanine--tRNA ligase [Candidatus Aminicenantales bacterium]
MKVRKTNRAIKAQEIRETFLDFFAQKEHKIVPSSLLLPKDDPTILFTNAGMNPFKNIFLGLETRSYKRAASVQKCMRVSGKHNDLEQVGQTNKHHTFFEMLGNFSFGDYFKTEAIAFAWELITEVFKLPQDRLVITVYEEDDEAFELWRTVAGVPEEKIFRFGKEENFWSMGETGPCGPCSEIHYDIDPDYEPGDPRSLIEKGSDRYLELWNLVFMQYFQDEQGNLHPLPSPSIDTGMGLERIAAALQGKTSNFDTDLFTPLIEEICHLAGREYPAGEESDISVRLIADHARAVSFLIGDGIMPSNEGRGYVLRRLIRRAFRHGSLLGIDKPFVYTLVSVVSDIMKDAYPELLSSSYFISKICLSEEERFSLTLSSGLRYFQQYVEEAKKAGKKWLGGEEVFKLYDTFGFPLDLSQELACERSLVVDEEGFYQEMEKQKKRARESWRGNFRQKGRQVYEDLRLPGVRYVGNEKEYVPEAEVLAILKDGKRVRELREGEPGEVILNETPFYAEAGGQVGDSGHLKGSHFSALVENTVYPVPEIISHQVKVLSGILKEGHKVEAVIDGPRRKAISGNHTATHLLHASLRQILGDHVKQAGSLVSPTRLRFDFTHFAPLSREELQKVESLVNEKIRENIPVEVIQTTLEKGLAEGAMAIFEEKYTEHVRMVVVDVFSKELCGGVHVHGTGEIGLFKIVSETSIAAGMRRIEALTAEEAMHHVQESETILSEIQLSLNTSRKDVLSQVEKLRNLVKEKEQEAKFLRQNALRQKFQKPEEEIRRIKGIAVLAQKVEGLNPTEVRDLADSLKQKMKSGVVILGVRTDEKAFLVISVSKDLAVRVSAVDVIKKVAPLIGGGGGGRPDFAQAGGTRIEELDTAIAESLSIIEKQL